VVVVGAAVVVVETPVVVVDVEETVDDVTIAPAAMREATEVRSPGRVS